jgi:hypothetical protein
MIKSKKIKDTNSRLNVVCRICAALTISFLCLFAWAVVSPNQSKFTVDNCLLTRNYQYVKVTHVYPSLGEYGLTPVRLVDSNQLVATKTIDGVYITIKYLDIKYVDNSYTQVPCMTFIPEEVK